MYSNIKQQDLEISFVKHLKNLSGATVKQNFDNQKKGLENGIVYFTLSNPRKLGHAYRTYNPILGNANHKEAQHFQIDYLINCVKIADSLEFGMEISQYLSSLSFMELMRKDGIGIQHLTEIRTLNIKDDKDNFVTECAMTLTVTFNRILSLNTSVARDFKLNNIKGI
jgi:hypothetical protein